MEEEFLNVKVIDKDILVIPKIIVNSIIKDFKLTSLTSNEIVSPKLKFNGGLINEIVCVPIPAEVISIPL